MPISITWGTKTINVPQSYLTNITGTLYELDTEQFRLDLKALEDDPEGMPFPDTHRHNTEVTVAGVTYARFIEIINGYSIEFENGAYSVRLKGSNNNFFDVENGILSQNQVQVIAQNAAGLIVHNVGSGVTEQDKLDIADRVWDEADGDHVLQGTFGGEVAKKADIAASAATSQVQALAGSVVQGSEDAGSYLSTLIKNNSYWQIGEDGSNGLTVELTFRLPSADHRPGTLGFFGRYSGQPALTHFLDLWLYNVESMSWELMASGFMPGAATSDETYTHEFYERHIDRANNNEVKARLIHNVTTYNASHGLWLDYAEATSIEVITPDDIAQSVWANENALRMIGLMQENYYLDQTTYIEYQGQKLMTSGRLRLYSNALAVGSENDVIAEYGVTSQWTDGALSSYKVTRVTTTTTTTTSTTTTTT